MSRWTDSNDIKTFIDPMAGRANELFPAASSVLSNIHKRQTNVLLGQKRKACPVWEFSATLDAPFISGLGAGHPTETGMVLDRNSGLPFIPAGSVKGVLRMACAVMLADKYPELVHEDKDGELEINDRTPLLRRYFGDTNTDAQDTVRGQLVFLDAYPASVPRLNLDIMNPHSGKYYDGSAPPVETDLPIPVKFLTVARKTTFIFRIMASPLTPGEKMDDVNQPFNDADKNNIRDMFSIACTRLGFGAKTSIGYGRFSQIEETDREAWQKRLQDLETEIESEKYPWRKALKSLEQIQDWGSLKDQALDNATLLEYQNEPEVGKAVAHAATRVAGHQKGKWDEARDATMTTWLDASGTAWTKQAAQAVEEDPLTKKIKGFSGQADYDRDLDFAALNQEQCALLNQKFKSWNWNNKKKAKSNNQKLYKDLQQRIKELKNN
jgi:CRISPR type III-B/RAMP module RAMP protein Cmr6